MCSRKKAPSVSEAEKRVLEVLWEDPPHSSSGLVRRLSSQGWSETTVKTLVSRLVKKGFAAFEQEGNRYLYRPLISREQWLHEETDRWMSRWTGEGFALLTRFVSQTDLSPRQIEELKSLLEEKRHGQS